MKKLIYLSIALLLIVTSCEELIDNPVDQTVTEDITSPTVWTSDKEWVVDGNVNVVSDLVIEPGTTVKFNPDSELAIGYGSYGSLKAVGTSEEPIIFTSATDNPTPGNYRGIVFWEDAASTSELEWCTIEYAGNTNGYDAALYIYSSSISVHNCTIKKSATAGISTYNGSFEEFSMNTISECGGYVMEIPASIVHLIDNTSNFTGSGVLINEPELTNEKVTWQTLTVPYVTSSISVNENAELTLSAGLHILFQADGWFIVGGGSYGKLVTLGTATEPVVFSSASTNPTPGNWRGIELQGEAGQNSNLSYTIIEYAGNSNGYDAALYLYDCGVSMTNSIIRHSAGMGVFLSYALLVTFENNTIEQCGDYPMSIPAQTVHKIASNNLISGSNVFINDGEFTNQTVTWNKLTVPYELEYLTVNENGTLTLTAGTSMLFQASGYLIVGGSTYGKLIANGTETQPIVFSSAAGSPSPGDWRGLEFWDYTMNGSLINNCKVLYGGSDDGYNANIYSYDNGSKLTISNSEIGYSPGYGIYASYCTPNISNITYIDCSTDYAED